MSQASIQAAHDFTTMPDAYQANGVPCPRDCSCRGMADSYLPPVAHRVMTARDTVADSEYRDMLREALHADECPSVAPISRQRCTLPLGHPGLHRSGVGGWN